MALLGELMTEALQDGSKGDSVTPFPFILTLSLKGGNRSAASVTPLHILSPVQAQPSPAPFPLQCPVAAAPTGPTLSLRAHVGRASAAPPGNRQEMNGTIRQSPAMDILRLSASMPGGGCALPGLHSPCALL